MPIEIRELIIKTSITEKQTGGEKHSALSRRDIDKIKKEIIDHCVEKITDQINKEKER